MRHIRSRHPPGLAEDFVASLRFRKKRDKNVSNGHATSDGQSSTVGYHIQKEELTL